MKKGFGKLGLICLGPMVALGTLGVSVVQWQESLPINTVVQAGELDVGLKWYWGCETSPYISP